MSVTVIDGPDVTAPAGEGDEAATRPGCAPNNPGGGRAGLCARKGVGIRGDCGHGDDCGSPGDGPVDCLWACGTDGGCDSAEGCGSEGGGNIAGGGGCCGIGGLLAMIVARQASKHWLQALRPEVRLATLATTLWVVAQPPVAGRPSTATART